MQAGKANVVIGGQWGSEGKGKLVGYLTCKHTIDIAVCNFMPNAGHTFVDRDGIKHVFKQLPTSAFDPNVHLIINAGAGIRKDTFLSEIEKYNVKGRLTVHPRAIVIEDKDREWEAQNLAYISSTGQGAGSALSRKISRASTVQLARDVDWLEPFIGDTSATVLRALMKGATVLVEGAQGYGLSINHGTDYPHCTSRDVTVSALLSDAGIHPSMIGTVYGAVRTLPIRVGHMYDDEGRKIGDSGPGYFDQRELTWEEVSEKAGMKVTEQTTVTDKTRRVFTFSMEQYRHFLWANRPDEMFLNFVNYLDQTNWGVFQANQLGLEARALIDLMESYPLSPKINLIGTGEKFVDMVER